MERIIEKLEEILSICVGADSPDALKNGKENPAQELANCRKDISAIADLTEEVLEQLHANNYEVFKNE